MDEPLSRNEGIAKMRDDRFARKVMTLHVFRPNERNE